MPRLRMSTASNAGKAPGQPGTPRTDPDRIKHKPSEGTHYCGECFRPRRSGPNLFCGLCARTLFGSEHKYESFIRSMRAYGIQRERRRKARQAQEAGG
jgi:hypothetical protein